MNSKRLVVFDVLKIVLAFLVVNLHIESFVTHGPFSTLYFAGWYAVPLFVTMSFYFAGKNYLSPTFRFRDFFGKLSRFAIPFMFWSIIGFILHPDLISFKYLFRQLLTGTAVDPPLYYLSTVMIVSFLIYLSRKLILSKKLYLLITILLLLLIESSGLESRVASSIPIQVQLASIRVFEFIKYAILGIGLSSLKDKISSYSHKSAILVLSTVAILIQVFYMWVYQIDNLSYGGFIQFSIITLIMISVMMYSHLSFSHYFNESLNQLGALTLGVYCLHTFFLERISWSSSHYILTTLVFGLSLIVSVIIKNLGGDKLKIVVS